MRGEVPKKYLRDEGHPSLLCGPGPRATERVSLKRQSVSVRDRESLLETECLCRRQSVFVRGRVSLSETLVFVGHRVRGAEAIVLVHGRQSSSVSIVKGRGDNFDALVTGFDSVLGAAWTMWENLLEGVTELRMLDFAVNNLQDASTFAPTQSFSCVRLFFKLQCSRPDADVS